MAWRPKKSWGCGSCPRQFLWARGGGLQPIPFQTISIWAEETETVRVCRFSIAMWPYDCRRSVFFFYSAHLMCSCSWSMHACRWEGPLWKGERGRPISSSAFGGGGMHVRLFVDCCLSPRENVSRHEVSQKSNEVKTTNTYAQYFRSDFCPPTSKILRNE